MTTTYKNDKATLGCGRLDNLTSDKRKVNMTNNIVKTRNKQVDKETIDIIKDRIDLVEVIEKHIDLKKAGSAYVGLCPFHDEKTPSFSVKSNHYHCYGCEAHGDVFDFLEKHLNLPFIESLERLSSEHGISTISSMGEDERKSLHESVKRKREKDERKRAKEKENAAKEANRIWDSSSTEPHNDPKIRKNQLSYVVRKGIPPTGVRFGTNQQGFDSIIIPTENIKGEIRSLQFISDLDDPQKKFLSGSEKQGNFFKIGQITDGEPFTVSEGYATAVSVHEGSDEPVIAAMDSGNLLSVISNLRGKYPNSEITIAGDNDDVGQKKAKEAAKLYGCKVVFPEFPKGKELNKEGKRRTDFNDLQEACGIEEVRKQIENATHHPEEPRMDKSKESEEKRISTSVEKPIRFWEQEGLTYQKFPYEVLPLILRHAAQEISRTVKVPIEMASGSVLSATATSFHNNVVVVEKNHLEHYVTFFKILVAESSERKSKTFERATAPLMKYTIEREKVHQEAIFKFKGMKRVIDQQITAIINTIKPESTDTENNKCAEDIAKLEAKLKSHEPPASKFFTTDTTEPAFVKCLERNNGCFSLLSSEGGDILDYISGTKSNDKKINDSVFLKIITGDSIGRERVGSKGEGESIYIPKACGNILVMIQPKRFHEFMSNPALRDCGLISRVSPILAYENSMVGERTELDENGELKIDDSADMKEYEHLLLTFLKNTKPIRVGLSNKKGNNATLARAQFHDEIERQLGVGGELRDVADIAGKATTFATKLAALFHLSKNPGVFRTEEAQIYTEISEEDFLEAAVMQRYFLGQAVNTQRTTASQAKLNQARDVLNWIIKKTKGGKLDVFKYSDIYVNYGKRPKLTAPETKKIVEILKENGWVLVVSGEKDRFSLRKSQETEVL